MHINIYINSTQRSSKPTLNKFKLLGSAATRDDTQWGKVYMLYTKSSTGFAMKDQLLNFNLSSFDGCYLV